MAGEIGESTRRRAGIRFGVGIEDTFVPQSRPGLRPLDEYELTGHYDRWREDVDLVASTGARALRYGLPWYRVERERRRFDWSWADAVVDRILGHGIELTIDLVHYGTPLWLDRSFDAEDYPELVAEYAGRVAARYGDRVRSWTPLNEPHITAQQCGERGVWPPYLTGECGYLRVLERALRGAALSQRAIAASSPGEPRFVHCEASLAYEVGDGSPAARAEADRLAERRFLGLDLLTGAVGERHPMVDELRRGGVGDEAIEWFAEHPTRIDLLGVNYYPTFGTVRLTDDGAGGVRADACDRWADGLEGVIRDYAARYAVPVYVSETSLNGPVEERRRWLADSLAVVRRLAAEGLPVVGYTWWPVIDMIEWEYRDSGAALESHVATMGLFDLVPAGGGRFAVRPNALLERFRAEVAAEGER